MEFQPFMIGKQFSIFAATCRGYRDVSRANERRTDRL
jgi:hypothetical protein